MASQITRELSITYNDYKVGGDQTNRVLRDIHTLEETYDRAVLEYRFLVKHSTKALFAAECAAAETAFRTPHADGSVDLDGTNLKSYAHSSATGFNATPRIIKRGEPTDSARSRTYTVRIEFGLPGTSTAGYRRITKTGVNVAYSPARRKTLTINAEFTANDGNTAFANMNAAAGLAAFASSVQTDVGGTWKLAEQPTSNYDDANKVITVTAIYEEIIFTGVGSSDADLRREVLTISRNKVGPGDTPSGSTVKRLVTLNVRYDVWLNKEASLDLRSRWNTLRNRIMTQVSATLGGGSVALVSEDPVFDYTDNHIIANMTCFGASSNGIIENRVTTEIESLTGLVLAPVWHRGPYDRFIYQGPATERKTVTVVSKALGGQNAGGGVGAGGPANGAPGGGIGAGAGISVGGGGFNIGGTFVGFGFGGTPTGASQTALVNAALFAGNEPGSTFGGSGAGGGGGGGAAGGGGGAAGGGGQGSWHPISMKSTKTPLRLGIDGHEIDIEESTVVATFERADPVAVGEAT